MAVADTLINSVKIVLMFTGVVFISILVSVSVPQLQLGPAASDLPSLWSRIRAWLQPPYLYFIINAIIITIAASSRLHHSPPKQTRHQHDVIAVRADQFSQYDAVSMMTEVVNSATTASYYGVVSAKDVDVEVVGLKQVEKKEMISSRRAEKAKPVVESLKVPEIGGGGAGDKIRQRSTVVQRSMWATPPPLMRQQPLDVSPEFMSERPPASTRFGHHRRPAKTNPTEGGKALRRVAKPKKHDTLECTWKAITEGRHMPLTRHLKKSDTWEAHGRQINLLDDSFPDPPVKKSETFKDRTNHPPPPVPKLKKEPSLSHDELNRRVEAFINKFNEEMRLQRQQSIQQFMDKINRAAY